MITRLLFKFLLLIISTSLIFSPVAFADDEVLGDLVVTLEKGGTAPFSGTLFSTTASVKLLVNLELANESCQIKIDKAVDINTIKMQFKIDILQASHDSCQEKYKNIIQIKDDHIEFLDTQLTKAASPKTEMWFGIGLGSGVLLTIASAWALGHVSSSTN